MRTFLLRFVTVLALCSSLCWGADISSFSGAMRDSELLALVAGGGLPENIVHEIKGRGLGFHVSDAFRNQLKLAGADSQVLAALDGAKTGAGLTKERPSAEFLQHIAEAGDLIRHEHYTDAVRELNAALRLTSDSAEVGFVMGGLLRQQEKWMEAASVYLEVLNGNPDFPEVHTKMAFVLYYLGDEGGAMREAKEALTRNSDNPEAHKNMGLALEAKRSFDAAIVEYREALRLKPDYAAVHYDLGSSLPTGESMKMRLQNTGRQSPSSRRTPLITII
jgi:tetratricopeptide (TPR) repeat protein